MEKDFDPSSPTYYLDTSTLSHAFSGVPPELGRLKSWIESIAASANLCISFVHVGECSDWETGWESFAAWIDRMPFVWALTLDSEPLEVEAALKRALGLPGTKHRPFGRLGRSMRQGVDEARTLGWHPVKALPLIHTDAIRENLAEVARAGISKAALDAERSYNLRVCLRTLARDAHERLIARKDAEYMEVQLGQAVQDKLVALYESDPTVMRGLRVSLAAMDELTEKAQSRRPGGKKEREQLPGFAGDELHAMYGAAWCDVFTCDGPTAQWVAPIRRQFGLAPPVVLQGHSGGRGGFIAELMATSAVAP